MSVVYTRRYIF